jgi:hypothetical protein
MLVSTGKSKGGVNRNILMRCFRQTKVRHKISTRFSLIIQGNVVIKITKTECVGTAGGNTTAMLREFQRIVVTPPLLSITRLEC